MRLATCRVVLTVSLLVCPQASWRMGGSFFAAPLSTGTTISSSSITTLVHAKVQRQFSSTRLRPSSSSSSSLYAPTRALAPPFPDGPCGGELVRLDPPMSGWLLPPRSIQVWLPPGYHRTGSSSKQQGRKQQHRRRQHHPTLYCHDGQNAVSDADSWTGRSWRLTGALTRLLDHGLLDQDVLPIVVLLSSTEGDFLPGIRRRHLEYGDINLPFSTAHADWVAQTVKPLVDRRFRTLAGATYAMGTSLGGQAALYLNLRHPDDFQGAACLSPCFHPGILAAVAEDGGQKGTPLLRGKKIYMDMGGDLGEETVPLFDLLDHTTEKHAWNPGYWWLDTSLQPAVSSMCQLLDEADVDYAYEEVPGGRHNERAWSLRIDKPLRHLLGKKSKA